MSYNVKSSLIKTSGHYTAEQLWAVFKPMTPVDQHANAERAIKKIVPLCVALNLDEVAVGAIVWIETGAAGSGLPFRSRWWRERFNLGNLGVTGTPSQDEASQRWSTPEEGALGLMAHIVAYVYGSSWRSVWDEDELGEPQTWDKRFPLVLSEYGGARNNSLEALNGKWAWDVDNNYHGKLAERANKIESLMDDPPVDTPSTPEEPVVDTSKLILGRVPHPIFVRADVSKPDVQSGYGYDTVAARKNVGCCWHEWQGSGNESQAFVKTFFGPGGSRYTNALVDYAIMRDSAGTIIRLNDPRGTRSPWASGGGVESGGLEGDGPAFYNKFGLGAINSKLVSTEIVKSDGQDYTEAQIESAARLAAYWHDQDGQYYFEHPYTTKYGIVTSFLHFEFGTTNCGVGELDDITKVQARTRAIMQQFQEGADEQPPDNPPDVPDLPPLNLPGGISLEKARERFGKLRKIDAKVGTDKLLATYEFDPNGVISLGWANKCAEVFGNDYDKWPAAGDWIVFQEPIDKNTNDLITFDGWDQNMLRKNEQQGFIWV